jgi:hypothetical protein
MFSFYTLSAIFSLTRATIHLYHCLAECNCLPSEGNAQISCCDHTIHLSCSSCTYGCKYPVCDRRKRRSLFAAGTHVRSQCVRKEQQPASIIGPSFTRPTECLEALRWRKVQCHAHTELGAQAGERPMHNAYRNLGEKEVQGARIGENY